MYIGRDVFVSVEKVTQNGAVLAVKCPAWMVVTDSDIEFSVHMESQTVAENLRRSLSNRPARGEYVVLLDGGLWIGRGIEVELIEVESDGFVRIGVEAARTDAVTRDSFTFEEHMTFQTSREAGNLTVPGRPGK